MTAIGNFIQLRVHGCAQSCRDAGRGARSRVQKPSCSNRDASVLPLLRLCRERALAHLGHPKHDLFGTLLGRLNFCTGAAGRRRSPVAGGRRAQAVADRRWPLDAGGRRTQATAGRRRPPITDGRRRLSTRTMYYAPGIAARERWWLRPQSPRCGRRRSPAAFRPSAGRGGGGRRRGTRERDE